MSQPGELLFGVLASQLGFCTPDDVLSASRELVGRGDASLADVLQQRGLLDAPSRRLVERLAARAAATGGDAQRTLELLPLGSLRGAPRATPPDPIARLGAAAAVDEQPGRYHPVTATGEVLGASEGEPLVIWQDTVLGRDVAVRLGGVDDQRLIDEARLTGHLDHPAVVPVYELGRRASGELYWAAQRVTGRTLSKALAEATTLDERLALLPAFAVACRCVASAHDEAVVHRDLSSERVVLGRFGEVYVLGWGRARRGEQRSEERRVDLKCLGDMLGALLSGPDARPFVGAPKDLLAIARRTRLPPQEGGLESVQALARELEAFIDGRRVASYRYSTLELVRRYLARNRAFTSAMAVVAALLVVVAVLAQAQVRRERDQARQFAQRFLDDVAVGLQAVPGEEELVKAVTTTAVAHYERTTELERAPAPERRRLAEAMLRLADVALSLGRADDARSALTLARRLSEGLLADEVNAQRLVLVGQCFAADARLAMLLGSDDEIANAQQGLALAERALGLEPTSSAANLLASRMSRELGGLGTAAQAEALVSQALRYGDAALKASPGDVEVMLEQSRNLSLMPFVEGVALDPPRRRAYVEDALALLRQAQQRAPDRDDVREEYAHLLGTLGSLLELEGERERAHAVFAEARQAAQELLRHQPDGVAVFPTLVEVEVNLGLYQEAWHHFQAMERQGTLGELAPVGPGVAFLAGADEEAIRLARAPNLEDQGAALVYRALAASMLGRPGDAAIAARAARGKVQYVPWRPYAVFTRVVTAGRLEEPGRRAVFEFARAYDAALPLTDVTPLDAALERFIAALEAQVPR